MKKTIPVIQVQGLWAGYDSQPVLEDINLEVLQGDFIGLIGPNGGGKTTLLRTLIGLIEPMKGEISVMGFIPQKGRCHIGYVPQQVAFDREFPCIRSRLRIWLPAPSVICLSDNARGSTSHALWLPFRRFFY